MSSEEVQYALLNPASAQAQGAIAGSGTAPSRALGAFVTPAARYLLAIGFMAIAALLCWALPGVQRGTLYLLFYPAVVGTAALCGLGPGILATIGSLLLVDLFFDVTPGWVDVRDPVVVEQTVICLVGGFAINLVASMQRAAHARDRQTTRELDHLVQELKAAKTCAEQAQAAAELANCAKDHFLAILSHELRTPLTPVQMGASMLQQRPNLDPVVRETLEIVRRNVEMEARLIDDLLDVTRIARGKMELHKEPVQLSMILDRSVEVCMPDIEARRLHFGMDMGPDAPYWIEGDPARLQQVFWNLLKNAVKFTPRGGCVGVRVRKDGSGGSGFGVQGSGEHGRASSEAPAANAESQILNAEPNTLNPDPRTLNPFVVIEVSDSGMGIDPDALSRIFNAFEQAERSVTRQFGGLGLGLAIGKAMVELHGGTIEACSAGRDRGATFRVRLPLSPPPHRPEEPLAAPPRAVQPLRILLVEDHGVTAKMMQWVLTEDGHEVTTAGDVATALELAEQNSFDLLVSDLGLPDGNGHDLLRRLRQRGHEFPAIALSGYGQEQDIQSSHDAGFTDHLIKPASRERLLEAVASVGIPHVVP